MATLAKESTEQKGFDLSVDRVIDGIDQHPDLRFPTRRMSDASTSCPVRRSQVSYTRADNRRSSNDSLQDSHGWTSQGVVIFEAFLIQREFYRSFPIGVFLKIFLFRLASACIIRTVQKKSSAEEARLIFSPRASEKDAYYYPLSYIMKCYCPKVCRKRGDRVHRKFHRKEKPSNKIILSFLPNNIFAN